MRIVAEDFIGKEYETNISGKCFVVDCKNSYDMTVMFYDGFCSKVYKGNLDKGKVYNPYYEGNLIHGVGVFDRPKNIDKVFGAKVRNMWYNMLERCYCEKFHKLQPTYKGAEVDDRWKIFSKFEADVQNMLNFEKCITDRWVLDKDGISIGNKVYSKENCCFIPQSLNSKLSTITFLENFGGGCSLLPYGSYRVCVSGYGSHGHVGCYRSLEEAYSVYKEVKGRVMLDEVFKYAGIIDDRLIKSVEGYIKKHVHTLCNSKNLVGGE